MPRARGPARARPAVPTTGSARPAATGRNSRLVSERSEERRGTGPLAVVERTLLEPRTVMKRAAGGAARRLAHQPRDACVIPVLFRFDRFFRHVGARGRVAVLKHVHRIVARDFRQAATPTGV